MSTSRFAHVSKLVQTASGGKSFVRKQFGDGKIQVVTTGPNSLNSFREMTLDEAEQEFGEKQRVYNILTTRILMGFIALVLIIATYFWPVISALFGIGG